MLEFATAMAGDPCEEYEADCLCAMSREFATAMVGDLCEEYEADCLCAMSRDFARSMAVFRSSFDCSSKRCRMELDSIPLMNASRTRSS